MSRPEHREATVSRFKETGGLPPEGVRMVGRWHAASLNRGFVLAEASDLEAVARWCHRWADLISFEIGPVIDDEGIRKVLAS
ncbi:MAG: DUF3303 family protein [Candidatus Deferrimicrobiaceae bacterium]